MFILIKNSHSLIASNEKHNKNWKILRKYQPNGPLFNSQFYVGWITHWQRTFSRFDTNRILEALNWILEEKSSFNLYMFYGGTNYGFTSGANIDYNKQYAPIITSYDYDALLDESGDPTLKYFAIRQTLAQYVSLPNITIPTREAKMNLGKYDLRPVTTILSKLGRKAVTTTELAESLLPLSFESINQNSGFVLYETKLPIIKRDPSLLTVNGLHDRALVYVDQQLIGILSRENNIYSIPISESYGQILQILVENQGRISALTLNDRKGILGNVSINGQTVINWNITGYSFENYKSIGKLANYIISNNITEKINLKNGPTLFYGEFILKSKKIYDTYLDMTGWGKVTINSKI